MCGIDLVTYYATFLFENSLGFAPDIARLLSAVNGTEYFLASLIALPLIDVMFARANFKGISLVKHSLEMPHLSGPEVDRELLRYFRPTDTESRDQEMAGV
jgi:hypothetical protein